MKHLIQALGLLVIFSSLSAAQVKTELAEQDVKEITKLLVTSEDIILFYKSIRGEKEQAIEYAISNFEKKSNNSCQFINKRDHIDEVLGTDGSVKERAKMPNVTLQTEGVICERLDAFFKKYGALTAASQTESPSAEENDESAPSNSLHCFVKQSVSAIDENVPVRDGDFNDFSHLIGSDYYFYNFFMEASIAADSFEIFWCDLEFEDATGERKKLRLQNY